MFVKLSVLILLFNYRDSLGMKAFERHTLMILLYDLPKNILSHSFATYNRKLTFTSAQLQTMSN